MFERLFSKKYVVECPDGTTRTVYHRVNDVFPLHLKHTKKSANVSIDLLKQLKAKTGFENTEAISAILADVDKINRSIQQHFRAAYAVYEASPCTELPYFKEKIETVIKEEQRLRTVETVMKSAGEIMANGSYSDDERQIQIDSVLSNAMQILIPVESQDLTNEMLQVEGYSKLWARDE